MLFIHCCTRQANLLNTDLFNQCGQTPNHWLDQVTWYVFYVPLEMRFTKNVEDHTTCTKRFNLTMDPADQSTQSDQLAKYKVFLDHPTIMLKCCQSWYLFQGQRMLNEWWIRISCLCGWLFCMSGHVESSFSQLRAMDHLQKWIFHLLHPVIHHQRPQQGNYFHSGVSGHSYRIQRWQAWHWSWRPKEICPRYSGGIC